MPDQLPVWFFTMSEPWAPVMVFAYPVAAAILVIGRVIVYKYRRV